MEEQKRELAIGQIGSRRRGVPVHLFDGRCWGNLGLGRDKVKRRDISVVGVPPKGGWRVSLCHDRVRSTSARPSRWDGDGNPLLPLSLSGPTLACGGSLSVAHVGGVEMVS